MTDRQRRATFANKVVIVTGSSKGWGRGVAEAFAAAGASVIVNGFSKPDDVMTVVSAIKELGGKAVGVVADVRKESGAQQLVDTAVQNFGRVDVLVNCAAVKKPGPMLEMTLEEWEAEMTSALNGTFLCVQKVSRQMIKQGGGGRIINMAGASGVRGQKNHANGAASKAGVLAATWSWAAELEPHGITVNAVRGAVRTPGNEQERVQLRTVLGLEGIPADVADRSFGFYEPHEAAEIILWLGSDEAGNVTGVYFGIDGARITVWQRPRIFQSVIANSPWLAEDIGAWVGPVVESLCSFVDEPILPRGAEASLKYERHA